MNLLTEQTMPHPEVFQSQKFAGGGVMQNFNLLHHEGLAPNTDAKLGSGFGSFGAC